MIRFVTLGRCAFALAVLSIGGHAAMAKTDPSLPFRGSADVQVTSIVPHPDGVRLIMSTTGVGEATHLGRYTRDETLLLNPVTFEFTGTITFFAAAHGDELEMSFVGGFNSPTTAVGTYTITGGKGRFANATGGATFGVATPDLVNAAVTFDGTIQY